MRYAELPHSPRGGAAKISVLGFGCAPLMGRVGRRESLAALGAAEAAGINFFDTARSYGYGEGEALLGEFLKGRRQSIFLCTKFGILPTAAGLKQKLKPVAQAAIRLFPGLRKHARRHAGPSSGGHFTLDVLRQSFDASLRALQTDYVDILLLHAAPVSVLDQDDLLEALGRLVESGKVRMAGISGDPTVIAETFRRQPPVLTTAQFAMNPSNLGFVEQTRQPEARRLLLVANHPFGGAAGIPNLERAIETMRGLEELPAELRAKIAERDPQLNPEILLNAILDNTGITSVLPSMVRAANLAANVRAVEYCRFTSAELELLRGQLIRLAPPA